MKIERLSILKKNNPNIVNVELDNGQYVVLHSEIIVKNCLSKNSEITQSKLNTFISESNVLFATACIIKYLSNKIKSTKQIYTYLASKGYDEEVIETVMQKLKEYKIADDQKYAAAVVKQNQKANSSMQIKVKLIKENIDKNIITEATQNLDDFSLACKLAEKYFKNKDYTEQNIQKFVNHLHYKGFDWETISKVLSRLKEQ